MKIRIVMQNLRVGGAERILITFLNNFDRKKYNVELLLHTFDGELLKKVPEDVKVSAIVPRDNGRFLNRMRRSLFFRLLKVWPALISFIFRYKYSKTDLTISYLEGISTAIAALFNGPKVAWVHTDVRDNPWADAYFRNKNKQEKCYRKFQKIVFVSNGSKLSFQKKFTSVNKKSEVVIHNPIDLTDVRQRSRVRDLSYCEWEKKTSNSFRIITVGRLDPVKRVPLLLEAFRCLQESNYRTSLTIVGTGTDEANIKESAKNMKNVYFTGSIENPMPYVCESQLFVSTSSVESYPTSIIEALALNVRVLATRNIGSEEVLKESEWGKIVSNDIKSEQLSRELESFITKSLNTNQLLAGLDTTFDLANILIKYNLVFEEAIKIYARKN